MKILPLVLASSLCAYAAPFELKDGDRVLLLGDALLERENTYGLLETRMHEQFPNTKFTVRNLSWSGETPRGWSRASFDKPEVGWQRLKEQIAEVKPTVAILGFGMAASLQEMTDRSGDHTLNPDPARYGAEPMTAARFKKELGELMDAINASTPDKQPARFILLSPIKHEDLRAVRPGLPDPKAHNALLEQYTKAIQELAAERKGVFVPPRENLAEGNSPATDNGISLNENGYRALCQQVISPALEWTQIPAKGASPVTPLVLRKNDLFFHQFRPANSTYLFGFRKHEQGRNAAEMPQFTPFIEGTDKEIDTLKRQIAAARAESAPGSQPPATVKPAPTAPQPAKAAAPLPQPTFTVADGFELTLWADTTLVGKPVGMNWDASGRLWVACSPVYPQIQPGAHPEDKVVVLEDTDRDGKADKGSTFASNLLIAAGVAPDFGSTKENSTKVAAAYVGSSTELVRVEDTNGDGTEDQRRVVLSGFGTEDTHHTIHTLRWGPDGKLYFNQSIYIHSHMETPWGMVRLNSGGICAYDPRTERVEVFARGFINTWGHAWDKWGQSFATDGAGFEGLHWIIPGAMYRTYEGARRILPSISPGSYPKYCGLEIIQSPLFPADWQGNAITCDFRAHKLTRFQINDLSQPAEGKDALSGYVTKELPNPVVTTDASFRPIDVKLGPDGALYIADWTNPIINHGEVDFRDPRRDHVNGRIWRLAPKGVAPLKWDGLAGKDLASLVKSLASENSWTQEQARKGIEQLLNASTHSEGRENPIGASQPQGLLLLEAIRQLGDEPHDNVNLKSLLSSPDPRLRAMAARLSPLFSAAEELRKHRKAFGEWAATFDGELSSTVMSLEQSVREKKQKLETLKAAPRPNRPEIAIVEQLIKQDESTIRQIKDNQAEIARDSALASTIATSHTGQRTGHHASILKSAVSDPNPRVRVEAMRALAQIPSTESVTAVLEAALRVPGGAAKEGRSEDKGTNQFNQPTFSDTADPHYGYAAWLSINELDDEFLKALADGSWKPDTADKQKQFAWALGALRAEKSGKALADYIAKNGVPKDGSGPWIELIGQAGGSVELSRVQELLVNSDAAPVRSRGAEALARAARERNVRPEKPAALRTLLDRTQDEGERVQFVRLVGAWKSGAEVKELETIASATNAPRLAEAAAISLGEIGNKDAGEALKRILAQAVAAKSPVLPAATRALAARDFAAASTHFPAYFGTTTDANGTTALWRALLTVSGVPDKLAQQPPQGLSKESYTAGLRAARELGKRGEKLVAALTPLSGETASPAATMDIAGLVDFTKKNGNPVQGEQIYRRAALTCTVCHAIGGAGGKVGPDLGTIGASAPLDYIIESMINPGAKVKEGFHAVALSLKDGRTLSGTVSKETDSEVVLRDMTGVEQKVEKGAVKERTNIGSLMPAGLLNTLKPREQADLYAFLAQLGKPGPFDASKASIARTWRVYPGDQVEAVVAGKADLAKGAAVYSLVDGRVTRELLELPLAMAGNNPTIVASARFSTVNAGQTRLHFAGVSKAWLNGKPLAIASDPNPVMDLPAGEHTIVVKLDVSGLPEHFRLDCPEARFLTE